MPVFFSRLFGATANDMWASASAMVMLGNATDVPAASGHRGPLDGHTNRADRHHLDARRRVRRLSPLAHTPGVSDLYVPRVRFDRLVRVGPHARPAVAAPNVRPDEPHVVSARSPPQLTALDLARSGTRTPASDTARTLNSCGGAQLAIGRSFAVYVHRSCYTTDPLSAARRGGART